MKLADNKVADWSDHYIDYEKLKAILIRCSVSINRLDELSQKKPVVAVLITEAYKAGMPTPRPSSADLTTLVVDSAGISSASLPLSTQSLRKIAEDDGDDDVGPSEWTLFPQQRTVVDYGAIVDNSNSPPRDKVDDSGSITETVDDSKGSMLSRAFVKATTGVTDYLQRSYERAVRDTLKDIDKIANEFDENFVENIARVNLFYNQKLEELEGQIHYLKESVRSIRQAPVGPPPAEFDEEIMADEDNMETPLVSHRKGASMGSPIAFARAVARNLTSQMRNNHKVSSKQDSFTASSPPLLTGEDDALTEIDAETARKVREAESIQRALVDSYRTAKLLNNFAIMNYTGFVKIVKKYDKTMPSDRKGRYKQEIKEAKICDGGRAVDALATRMEKLYANWFCDRNISEARAQMLTKKGDVLEMDWSQLRLGYRMGMCSVLALWVCWDCIWGLLREGQTTIGGRTAFPVFRACGGLLMLQWCWGFSVWVWTRYRVNYIYLFDFNPSIVASPLVIFNEAVDNTLAYLLCALLYYKSGAHAIPGSFPAGVFPFILVMYTAYQLIFPLRTRGPMWETIGQVVTAPMTGPTFFHGYVGDIFTSMVKVFQDLAWTVFFVLSGDWMVSEDTKASTKHGWSRKAWYANILIPLLTLLPLWFRFNQCLRRYTDTGKRFPHLANACKYALSQTVTLFGAFHPLYMRNKRESQVFQLFWMFAFISSSLYSFWWDLYMVRLLNLCIADGKT